MCKANLDSSRVIVNLSITEFETLTNFLSHLTMGTLSQLTTTNEHKNLYLVLTQLKHVQKTRQLDYIPGISIED